MGAGGGGVGGIAYTNTHTHIERERDQLSYDSSNSQIDPPTESLIQLCRITSLCTQIDGLFKSFGSAGLLCKSLDCTQSSCDSINISYTDAPTGSFKPVGGLST